MWTGQVFYVGTRIYNLVLMHLQQVHLPTKPVFWPLEELLILRGDTGRPGMIRWEVLLLLKSTYYATWKLSVFM